MKKALHAKPFRLQMPGHTPRHARPEPARSKLLRGHAVDPQDVIREIEAVTKEDVERVAHRMFDRPFSASAVGRNIDGLKLL